LQGYLQGKDEGKVEGLVDMMGVMGIDVGRPTVEFEVAEGPAHEGGPASWIHVANAGAL
jgi:hypothetical protein